MSNDFKQTAQNSVASEKNQKTASLSRNDVEQLGKATKDLASHSLNEVKKTASEYLEKSQEKAKEIESRVEDQIQLNPVRTILIAASVGFLIGWMRKNS
jgi:ElaB/YqjD/DUF883 family membrane-anchored ribosome-binding protein